MQSQKPPEREKKAKLLNKSLNNGISEKKFQRLKPKKSHMVLKRSREAGPNFAMER